MAAARDLAANIGFLFRLGRTTLGQWPCPDMQQHGRPLLSFKASAIIHAWVPLHSLRHQTQGQERGLWSHPGTYQRLCMSKHLALCLRSNGWLVSWAIELLQHAAPPGGGGGGGGVSLNMNLLLIWYPPTIVVLALFLPCCHPSEMAYSIRLVHLSLELMPSRIVSALAHDMLQRSVHRPRWAQQLQLAGPLSFAHPCSVFQRQDLLNAVANVLGSS